MARVNFVCQKCGYESASWLGRCPNCGEWDSLVETIVSTKAQSSKLKAQRKVSKPLKLGEIKGEGIKRIFTGIGEFDRVLGGGIVSGSVILLAGEPGVGKSILMLEVGDALKALYVSGEESAQQLKLRAQRLGIKGENLLILEETNVEGVIDQIRNPKSEIRNPKLIIIDSIQSLYSEELTGIPGSIAQVRLCTQKLFNLAKRDRISLFLIGHITKEGMIAGPKTIEHLVDTVLYLEGERSLPLRILRSFKNRFGPTDEVGVFQMGKKGLEEVVNPSQFFLEERKRETPGSAVTVTIQGTRPILAEVESLVVPTKLTFPRRIASGISFPRLQVICAVLQKRLKIALGNFDVYTSVSGGLKITEPAADLAIALSIISSYKNRTLPSKMAVIGEVGLLGEIRRVSFLEKRIREAKKLGFTKVLSHKTQKDLLTLVKVIWR